MRTDPQSRRMTRRQADEGCWTCSACEAFNDPDDVKCWQCEETRE